MHKPGKNLIVAFLLLAGCATAQAPSTAPSRAAAGARGDSSWIARPALYEVFVRDFSPEGNFQGVTRGLERIEAAGANVVWLMPIFPLGQLNRKGSIGSPYAVADYRGINPAFGTADDLHGLIDAAHKRGLKVILDFVPNHTAWDHVWMREHPDFYTRDANGKVMVAVDNQGRPTDWTDVADLNYNNPAMRRAMIADMRYWLDNFNIDGYRMDVAHFVPDDFWKEALAELRTVKPILLLAEAGEPRQHENGFDLSYGWDSYGGLKEVWNKRASAGRWVEHQVQDVDLPNNGRRLHFTTNHDETAWDQPPITLFGGSAGARAAFVAMTLLPGTPLLYNGQEVESPQKLPLFEKETVNWNQPNATSTREFYAHVIHLQRTHSAFAGRDLTPLQINAADDVIAYRRGNAVVLVNTRPQPLSVVATGITLKGSSDLLSGRAQQSDTVALGGYGALVLQLR